MLPYHPPFFFFLFLLYLWFSLGYYTTPSSPTFFSNNHAPPQLNMHKTVSIPSTEKSYFGPFSVFDFPKRPKRVFFPIFEFLKTQKKLHWKHKMIFLTFWIFSVQNSKNFENAQNTMYCSKMTISSHNPNPISSSVFSLLQKRIVGDLFFSATGRYCWAGADVGARVGTGEATLLWTQRREPFVATHGRRRCCECSSLPPLSLTPATFVSASSLFFL